MVGDKKPHINSKQKIIRKGIYTIEEVLDKAIIIDHHANSLRRIKKFRVDFDGDLIHMASLRYEVFKKSLTCCKCGLTGSFFAKEKYKGSNVYHFNLYAINDKGEEVLMTKDHIIPKALGGKDVIENMQTMCTICNAIKGCTLETED